MFSQIYGKNNIIIILILPQVYAHISDDDNFRRPTVGCVNHENYNENINFVSEIIISDHQILDDKLHTA